MAFSESTNYHDAIAPGQEVGKAERQLDAAISGMVGGGSSSSGLQVVYISTSTGVVQSSTSEGNILGSTGVGSKDLPADFFAEGVVLRFTARGVYSAVDGTANLNLKIKLDTTLMVETGNFIPPTSANKYWEISGLIVCRSAGATGTVMPSAHFSYDDGAGEGMVTTTTKTIETTAELGFGITAQCDTSDPDNSISCTQLVLEKLQVGNASLAPADVVIEFASAGSTAATDATTKDITVELTMPIGIQLASQATMDWSATNVSGTSSGTVTFPTGSQNGDTQTITVTLDYSAGDPVVTLSSPSSNATLGAEDEHTVTLTGLSATANAADYGGTATGIMITSGDTVSISVDTPSQTWTCAPADGPRTAEGTGSTNPGAVMSAESLYSLIGKIGAGGSWFYVGLSVNHVAGATGELYLGPNDSTDPGQYADNTGSLDVTVLPNA